MSSKKEKRKRETQLDGDDVAESNTHDTDKESEKPKESRRKHKKTEQTTEESHTSLPQEVTSVAPELFDQVKQLRKQGKADTAKIRNSLFGNKKKQSLKSSLRSALRLLNVPNLPEDVRQRKEAEVKILRKAVEDSQTKQHEDKLLRWYSHIKFFEKRKLLRREAQLLRQLNTMKTSDRDETSAEEPIRAELQQVRDNIDYVNHYPRGFKYISLFPTKKDGDTGEAPDLEEQRLKIRALVAKNKERALRLEQEKSNNTHYPVSQSAEKEIEDEQFLVFEGKNNKSSESRNSRKVFKD